MENDNEKKYMEFLDNMKTAILFQVIEALFCSQPEVVQLIRSLIKHGCPADAIIGAMEEYAKNAAEEGADDE